MNSADKLKQFFKKAELHINPESDEKIFQDVFDAQQKTIKSKPVQSINIWKTIMKSQISKMAAAAVVIIACVAVLTLINTTSGIVLANVLTQIKKINSYSYQTDKTSKGLETNNKTFDAEFKEYILFSKEYGYKRILDVNNNHQGDTRRQEYTLLHDKAMIIIFEDQKKYYRSEIDEDSIEKMKNESCDPAKIIEMVLVCPYNSLGFSTINSKHVEGFETTDPSYAGGVYDKVDIKLWVDVKTKLPVKMEIFAEIEGQVTISGVIQNYQWNIPVDASEFEPVIPDDYTFVSGGTYKLPAITEEAAIDGLKLYADIFGSYPNPKELIPAMLTFKVIEISDSNTPAGKQLREELEKMSPEERKQKISDIANVINEAAFFYMSLVQYQKDPAYYGDSVYPGDKNNVLMRWKISDSDYRVIFGDLKVENVTTETLVKLEKTLPK
ncbi:MAG: hypothetical protein JW787_01585 [Sedimentisphaerales bacterium]|nr:hypothetical protein [Sedimentisphaerales bacterium]